LKLLLFLAVLLVFPPYGKVPNTKLLSQVGNQEVDYHDQCRVQFELVSYSIFLEFKEVDCPVGPGPVGVRHDEEGRKDGHQHDAHGEERIRVERLAEGLAHWKGYAGWKVLEIWNPEDGGVLVACIKVFVRVLHRRLVEAERAWEEEGKELEAKLDSETKKHWTDHWKTNKGSSWNVRGQLVIGLGATHEDWQRNQKNQVDVEELIIRQILGYGVKQGRTSELD
jgi:hypothetical protein